MNCIAPTPSRWDISGISGNLSNKFQSTDFDRFRNIAKQISILKIVHLEGPSESPRTIVLGGLEIVKQMSTYCPRTTFLQYVYKIWTQKRGGGWRPPPIFWERPEAATIFCQNIVKKLSWDNVFIIISQLWAPRVQFSKDSPSPPRWPISNILILVYFSRDPPECSKIMQNLSEFDNSSEM